MSERHKNANGKYSGEIDFHCCKGLLEDTRKVAARGGFKIEDNTVWHHYEWLVNEVERLRCLCDDKRVCADCENWDDYCECQI